MVYLEIIEGKNDYNKQVVAAVDQDNRTWQQQAMSQIQPNNQGAPLKYQCSSDLKPAHKFQTSTKN